MNICYQRSLQRYTRLFMYISAKDIQRIWTRHRKQHMLLFEIWHAFTHDDLSKYFTFDLHHCHHK